MIHRERAHKAPFFVALIIRQQFIRQQCGELAGWLRVDKATIELEQLKRRADHLSEWHTGETTEPGALICSICGEEIHFLKTRHIPPCPKCYATLFKRASD